MKTGVKRSILLELFDLQDGRCCYCDRFVVVSANRDLQTRPDAATIEHIERLADGGKNRKGNLAMACRRCNNERRDMSWLLYKSFRQGEFEEFMDGLR